MICVEIEVAKARSGSDLQRALLELVHLATPWPRVFFSQIVPSELPPLLQVISQIAGRLQVITDARKLDQSHALEVLNSGSSQIVVNTSQWPVWSSAIPAERMLNWTDGSEQTEGTNTGLHRSALAPRIRLAEWLEQKSSVAAALFGELVSDRADGLVPTLVCDPLGIALGLAYSSRESFMQAVSTGEGVYWSRSRGALWVKGAESGNRQRLLRVDLDCDADCLRFFVDQSGTGFCHLGTRSCFGGQPSIADVDSRIRRQIDNVVAESYSYRLAKDTDLLLCKLVEEARELVDAQNSAHAVWEAADVIYFALVGAARHGVSFSEIAAELSRRTYRVVRRD